MFRRYSLVIGTIVLLLGLGGTPPPAAAHHADKVTVCHLPHGRHAHFQTIVVSASALAAHLAHGDLPGACGQYCESLCNDDDLCTEDYCPAGTTSCAHRAISCSDGNPCTADSCNPATGCENTPTSGASCTAAVQCTGPGVCQTGVCVAAPIPGCCTVDADCEETPINLCTTTKCLKASPTAATGTCDDNPADDVQCKGSDLCHPQACDGLTGLCTEADIHCDDGYVCDESDGRCKPIPVTCPCAAASEAIYPQGPKWWTGHALGSQTRANSTLPGGEATALRIECFSVRRRPFTLQA